MEMNPPRYRVMILSEEDGSLYEVKLPRTSRDLHVIISVSFAILVSVPLLLFGAYMNIRYASAQETLHIASLTSRLRADQKITRAFHYDSALAQNLMRDAASLVLAANAAQRNVGIVDGFPPPSTGKISDLTRVLEYVSSILPGTTDQAIQQASYLAHSPAPFPFIWPVQGTITSPFGMRVDPVVHIYQLHAGIDIGGDADSPIVAAAGGLVTAARSEVGYGEVIFVSDGKGISTVYAHESRLLVHPGEWVNQGQVIGLMGATGWSTGPHLLFEILVNGEPVNPVPYLPPEGSPIGSITVVSHLTSTVRAAALRARDQQIPTSRLDLFWSRDGSLLP